MLKPPNNDNDASVALRNTPHFATFGGEEGARERQALVEVASKELRNLSRFSKTAIVQRTDGLRAEFRAAIKRQGGNKVFDEAETAAIRRVAEEMLSQALIICLDLRREDVRAAGIDPDKPRV